VLLLTKPWPQRQQPLQHAGKQTQPLQQLQGSLHIPLGDRPAAWIQLKKALSLQHCAPSFTQQ
jgi:hypothetical protein